ncbi:MAG: hypothetical protein ACKVP2_05465 [Burkholderiales bacterium]
MKSSFAWILFILFAAVPAVAVTAAEDVTLTIEQQLFNDFALRMQEQLQRSVMLLDRIRQSVDNQEREKLMNEYHELTRKTMKIHHLMHELTGGSEASKKAAKMKCKMMEAKGKGCGMMKKSGTKQADPANASPEESKSGESDGDGEPAQGGEGNASPEPKEKHH